MNLRFILAIAMFSVFACQPANKNQAEEQEQEAFHSEEFSEEGAYTSGIEGPATDKEGNIYAVNFGEQGTIGITRPDGSSELFVKLPEGSIGNGIRLNNEGDLMIADYTNHNVLKIDRATKEVSVFAHSEEMNQPNDLAIRDDGVLFASDPNWKESTGNLWRVDTDGTVTQLESNMGTTNGVEVSPDQKTLYVNESVQRNVWAYDLSSEGDISNKRLLMNFPDFGMDGMRCDVKGNIYLTRHGKGTVVIISPEGKLLKEIQLKGEKPTNIAFGGEDGKTCYVTLMDRGCMETFHANHPGRAWAMLQKRN